MQAYGPWNVSCAADMLSFAQIVVAMALVANDAN